MLSYLDTFRVLHDEHGKLPFSIKISADRERVSHPTADVYEKKKRASRRRHEKQATFGRRMSERKAKSTSNGKYHMIPFVHSL